MNNINFNFLKLILIVSMTQNLCQWQNKYFIINNLFIIKILICLSLNISKLIIKCKVYGNNIM